MLLNEIHPFYDGNGRTCKILFANDDKINLLMKQKLKILFVLIAQRLRKIGILE